MLVFYLLSSMYNKISILSIQVSNKLQIYKVVIYVMFFFY